MSWYSDLVEVETRPVGNKSHGMATPPSFQLADKKRNAGVGAPRPDLDVLKTKRAWEIALAPAKAIPMNLFMSYMSGNSLQIVPITMTLMMFFVTPFKQIVVVNQQFDKLSSPSNNGDILLTKLVYIVCHLLAVGAGVWKLGQMGLLPNHQSDWLAWEVPYQVFETAI